jgi:hypothetical protein
VLGCPIIPLLSSAGIDAYHPYHSDLLCSLYSKKEKKKSEKFLTIKGSAPSLRLGCSTASDTTFLSRRLWTRDTDHDLICIRLTKPPTSYKTKRLVPESPHFPDPDHPFHVSLMTLRLTLHTFQDDSTLPIFPPRILHPSADFVFAPCVSRLNASSHFPPASAYAGVWRSLQTSMASNFPLQGSWNGRESEW